MNNKNRTKEAIKNIFSFKGRMGRKNFFLFFISIFIILMTVGLVLGQGLIWYIFLSVLSFLHACNIVKRLHDLNKSGWHYWFSLIPIYNIYFAVVLFTRKGIIGANRYGLNQSNNNLNSLYQIENKISKKITMHNNNKIESFDLGPFDVGALVLAIIFWTAVIIGLWILMGGLISIN